MKLTALEIKSAKPHDKTYRLFDGYGLYLEITPKGNKYWRFKYRYQGKEKRISLGVYPFISLKEAREARDRAKHTLLQGTDPSEARKATRAASENTFQAIAEKWHAKFYADKEPGYAHRVLRGLEKDMFPAIGHIPIAMITSTQLRGALMRIEERGAHETAHRRLQDCSRIFRYAIAHGLCERDPTIGLKGALAPAKVTHFAAILDLDEIGALLRAIDSYDFPITRSAMQLGLYTFVRPANLRQAQWDEFRLEDRVWKISAEKMKMRKPHIVPLSDQSIEIVQALKPLTSNSPYLFPSVRNRHRPMSEATVNAALRRLGYSKEQLTGHGFRHMASTLLNEQGIWNPDAIERQLAHTDRSKIRGTYDHSKHLSERHRMMQGWADYLDKLKSPGLVISMHSRQRM